MNMYVEKIMTLDGNESGGIKYTQYRVSATVFSFSVDDYNKRAKHNFDIKCIKLYKIYKEKYSHMNIKEFCEGLYIGKFQEKLNDDMEGVDFKYSNHLLLAECGLFGERFICSDDYLLRILAIRHSDGLYLEQGLSDPCECVRAEVARLGYRLDILSDDPSTLVRYTVMSHHGAYVYKFIDDPDPRLRAMAKVYITKIGSR